MKYTAGTAAKAVGKTKSTITKAIASGRISAIKNDIGAWEIDPAEMHRVFPPAPQETVSKSSTSPPEKNRGNSKEIEALERLLKATEDQLEDVKTDRDHWRIQATNLLTKAPEPQSDTPHEQRKKIFGIF